MTQRDRLEILRRKMQQQNHPTKGSTIKVEPIRNTNTIMAIKKRLQNNPRNLCLFTLGINTAYRANELLSLRICDVEHLRVGDSLDIKQLKNNKYRRATLNKTAHKSLQRWLAVYPNPKPNSALFLSKKGGALSVSYVSRLVKGWCQMAGLRGNYGSHTLRKSWGYQQRVQRNAPVALLMRAYGHASEKQTLEYLCIQPKEISDLYLTMEL